MKRPPSLTESQKNRFGVLRQQLFDACIQGDTDSSKTIMFDLKNLLLPTGHHTKYYEVLLYHCELLIFKKDYRSADKFLTAIIRNTDSNTRLFQESSILLSIAKLHLSELNAAEEHLRAALLSKAITNIDRRRQFIKRISERFEEESLLASLGSKAFNFNADDIINEVQQNCMANTSDEQLFENIGKSIPAHSIEFMQRIHTMAKNQLTHNERYMLPPAPGAQDFICLGKRIFSGISRRIWAKICLDDSTVKKILDAAHNPYTISTIILTEIVNLEIGHMITLISASIITYIIRKRIDVYCKNLKPDSIMSQRYTR
ncbi:hypothetical protein [Desulfovibrio aminophilus]|uniref:hypothetical protein n=1 Tax=Desulfovibrio aminophilus TaxID=81425 RepID=UPI0012ECB7C8|nr:hypothetical protein [Desulfovibrio aminophilus]